MVLKSFFLVLLQEWKRSWPFGLKFLQAHFGMCIYAKITFSLFSSVENQEIYQLLKIAIHPTLDQSYWVSMVQNREEKKEIVFFYKKIT